MPELPEVESTRRTLEPLIRACRVERVDLRRADVCSALGGDSYRALLGSRVIASVDRRGKLLLIRSTDGPALGIHLGMTGRVTINVAADVVEKHSHAVWWLRAPNGQERVMVFNDARRFGGIECLSDDDAIADRLRSLGPDALMIENGDLQAALRTTRRSIKAALLDQSVIAGVGNIYADEALFAAGIRPTRLACLLHPHEVFCLADAIRATLASAVDAGGSTIRTYAGTDGAAGTFQFRHLVYGRGGEPCRRCTTPLRFMRLAQRATVYCPTCQRQARQ